MSPRSIVTASLLVMAAACDRALPSAGSSASPAPSLVITTQVRAAPGRCGAAPEAMSFHDAMAVGWWPEGNTWCRAAAANAPPQAWEVAIGGHATHRLVVYGQQASLIDIDVRLVTTTDAPIAPTPFVPCETDRRGQAFISQNWLEKPGDLACSHFRGPDFTLITAGFAAAHGTMPVLLATPKGRSAGTVVYLRGGPYQNLFHGLGARATVNHLLARWAGRATIAIPSYLGIDRVRIGDGDVARARAETAALVDALGQHGPVCVIAFSMGAAVAAPLVASHPAAQFLLAAPLAASPHTAITRGRARGAVAIPFALEPTTPGARAVTLPSDQATLSYFAGEQDRDLASRLGVGPHPNLRIAYAAGDIPVTRHDLAAVTAMVSAGAIVELPKAVGHSIEAPFAASAYRPLIDGFISRCLRADR